MLSKKTIIRFIIKCILVYSLLLILAFTNWGDSYSQYFQSAGNQLAKRVSHLGLVVQFQKNKGEDKVKYDIEAVLMNKDTIDKYTQIAHTRKKIKYVDVPSFNIAFNSIRQGWIPTILLLALIIATPIRFRWRKIRAIFWGMILIQAYILFKLIIRISNACITIDALGLTISESPFWKEVFYYLYLIFLVDMPMRLIAPIGIWILVCFRKEDLLKFKQKDLLRPKKKPSLRSRKI